MDELGGGDYRYDTGMYLIGELGRRRVGVVY